MTDQFGGIAVTSTEQAAQEVEKLAKAGVDVIKAHSGLTREDYKAIADTAHKHSIRVHAHVYAEEDVRNAPRDGHRRAQPRRLGRHRAALQPAAHHRHRQRRPSGRDHRRASRLGVSRHRRVPRAAAGSAAQEGPHPGDLRRGAALAGELARARLLPAHRSRDDLPRARRQAVHRFGHGARHGHRLRDADELPHRGALARGQGPRRHGHGADQGDRRADPAPARPSSASPATSAPSSPASSPTSSSSTATRSTTSPRSRTWRRW